MATVLLTAGTKGQRYALPHATIHMHPTGGGAKGYTEDVRIAYKEQEHLQNQVFYLIAKYSGHNREEIEEIFRREHFFNAVQAKDYGIVDEVPGDAEDLITIEDIKCRIQFQARIIKQVKCRF